MSSSKVSQEQSSSLTNLGERFKALLDTATTGYQANNNKNVKYEEIKSRCLVSAEKRLKNPENQKPFKSLWKAQSEMNTLVCVAKFQRSSYGPDQRIAKKSQMKIRFRCFPCRKKFNQFAKLLLHRRGHPGKRGDQVCYACKKRTPDLKLHFNTVHNLELIV